MRARALMVLGLALVAACAPTTPAPLPSGATAIQLRTQPPAGGLVVGGCATALLEPVVIRLSDQAMVFVAKDSGELRRLVWPAGFSARILDGVAELVTPFGNVYGREGDVLTRLGGGAADNGDLLVCFASPDEYRNVSPP